MDELGRKRVRKGLQHHFPALDGTRTDHAAATSGTAPSLTDGEAPEETVPRRRRLPVRPLLPVHCPFYFVIVSFFRNRLFS